MRILSKLCLLVIVFYSLILTTSCENENEWVSLFDGETLEDWKASESDASWQIENGAIVTSGSRSHLFYTGNVNNSKFKNFELKAKVKTTEYSNSGIYFHTSYQESGWPSKGYECQIVNSVFQAENSGYTERKMTGSLYGVRNVAKAPVSDNEWFDYHIIVQGKTIKIYINKNLIVDYTEPEKALRLEDMKERLLDQGTFALQCHDPASKVYFKDIKVRPLADDLPTLGQALVDSLYQKKLLQASKHQIPIADLHVHLKKGLTMEQTLEHARIYGFTYGIAYNCGINMGFESNDSLKKFIEDYKRPPQTYLAMQAEGREWLDIFSKETIDQFDYVFTDAMTWTNDNGKRMRLWLKEETEVGDPENFMDQLVDRIENIIGKEPIDIYVNATFLPEEIQDLYDELWTDERMDKVITVLKENEVAMEISARYKIPSARFIKRAKAEGVKFTFGTNNTSPHDLGRLEYCLDMMEECDLQPEDIWMPEVKKTN